VTNITNPDGSVTVTLGFPILVENKSVTSLTLTRPKFADLKVMDEAKGNTARNGRLIAKLSKIPPSSLEQLDGADFMALNEVVSAFLEPSPATGDDFASNSSTSETSTTAT